MAPLGALDFRNRTRFLVGRSGRRGLHAWADWRCQPAAALRVPDQRRRSPSNALDPGEVELRHRRRALPASAMAKGGEALESSIYPTAGLDDERRNLLARLEESLPEFVASLISHRPKALRGRSLREAMNVGQRTPGRLTELFATWNKAPEQMYRAAVLGVRRPWAGESGRQYEPGRRKRAVGELLTFWAMRTRSMPRPIAPQFRNRKCKR